MGQLSSEYLRRLAALLTLYAPAYAPCFPVVCVEERPCFLLGDVGEGLAPQPAQPGKAGQVAKQPYPDSQHGRCCVLAAVEPLPGPRFYQGRGQRTKRAYTHCMQQLAARYRQAAKLRLVLDNRTPHARSPFYDCLPAAMAEKVAARCEGHYPPQGGGWLTQMELDFSALSRQCLKRRLPTQARLAHPVYCWRRQRQAQGVKIRWQFTVTQARQTLNSQ